MRVEKSDHLLLEAVRDGDHPLFLEAVPSCSSVRWVFSCPPSHGFYLLVPCWVLDVLSSLPTVSLPSPFSLSCKSSYHLFVTHPQIHGPAKPFPLNLNTHIRHRLWDVSGI